MYIADHLHQAVVAGQYASYKVSRHAGEHGRVHITEAEDASDSMSKKSPLASLKAGEAVTAVVIGSAPFRQVSKATMRNGISKIPLVSRIAE